MAAVKNALFRFLPGPWRLPVWLGVQKIAGTAEEEIFRLREFVPKGRIAVDVGANIGLYSLVLSRIASKVEAFEPQAACADVLEACGLGNVKVHRAGLADRAGELALSVPHAGGVALRGLASFRPLRGEQARVQVPVFRLDDFQFRDVGFLKIDVEGFEIEVLRGAEETLRRERPVLMVEIEQRHLSFPMEEIFGWLKARGYRGEFYRAGRRHALEEFSYSVHQEPFLADTEAERYRRIRGKYVNNFLFFPV